MYERFTDRSRKVMQFAAQEAERFNHKHIGTEHILLGLVQEGAGVAANVIKNLGIDPRQLREEVERIVQRDPGEGSAAATDRPAHTPRAKVAIQYSIEEARNLNHSYVGTEHLLLGVIREQEGVAAQVLTHLGLRLETVREEVLNLLGVSADRPRLPEADVPSKPATKRTTTATDRPCLPAADVPHVVGAGPAAELDGHIEWLRGLMERFVAAQEFDRAAEVLVQIERVRAVRLVI